MTQTGKSRRRPLLEVIVCTVKDTREAVAGGAGRLELCVKLDQGGLTPPMEVVYDVLRAAPIPVHVMVRPKDRFVCPDTASLNRLTRRVRSFNNLPVDGLVMGYLKDGHVDLETMRILCDAAPRHRVTFHHAFDHAADAGSAIDALKQLPRIDRILTAGGSGTWEERQRRLVDFHTRARPELTIVAGGGMTAATIASLMRETPIREFHVGSAAREQGRVTAERVYELMSVLRA